MKNLGQSSVKEWSTDFFSLFHFRDQCLWNTFSSPKRKKGAVKMWSQNACKQMLAKSVVYMINYITKYDSL